MLGYCSKNVLIAGGANSRDYIRGGSRAPATSKMKRFVIIVNGFQALTIITKRCILDNAAALDPPLSMKKI